MMPPAYSTPPEPIAVPPYRSKLLRAIAWFFSVLLHPLLMSFYVVGFLMYFHPAVFVGVDEKTKRYRLASTILFTIFFPAITLLLARALKLVRNVSLPDRQDRIIGYLVAMFFYWWTWNVFRNLPDTPPVIVRFTFGMFLTVCGGWFCNIFFKISMHALALAAVCCFFLLFAPEDSFTSGLFIAIPLLATGLGLTSRLLLGAHRNVEIISGIIVGLLSQYIAWLFYGPI